MIPILQALIRKQFCLFFLLFNFQLVSSDIFAQSANDVIQELMKETGSVGMSVAVVKKGKLIFTDAYGYRDLENKKPLDSKQIFRIASISKSFTATSIMQLVDAGKVNLDEDVSNLIGFTVGFAICTHSGLSQGPQAVL